MKLLNLEEIDEFLYKIFNKISRSDKNPKPSITKSITFYSSEKSENIVKEYTDEKGPFIIRELRYKTFATINKLQNYTANLKFVDVTEIEAISHILKSAIEFLEYLQKSMEEIKKYEKFYTETITLYEDIIEACKSSLFPLIEQTLCSLDQHHLIKNNAEYFSIYLDGSGNLEQISGTIRATPGS